MKEANATTRLDGTGIFIPVVVDFRASLFQIDVARCMVHGLL